MGNNDSNCSPLEQELAQKASELEARRREREGLMVDITLKAIADRVVSKSADIMVVMSAGKNGSLYGIREIVMREVVRAADGLLWCPEYVEKLGGEQHVRVFTGSHWEAVEPQQWKD